MQPIKKRLYIGLSLLVFSLVLFAGSSVCLAAPTFNRPVDGSSHVANAISVSKAAFSGGASTVVVTSVDSYADSLTAAVLAKVYGGPLLLTSSSSLSADVASELTRLNPGRVFLVGLSSSLASSVKAAVPAITDSSAVVPLKGSDRYETAALVAAAIKSKTGTVSRVVIAPGDSYGYALAASSLAAAQGWPLLLMPAAGPLPQSGKDAIADLGVSSGVVVGTNAALGVSGFTVTKRIVGTPGSGDSDGRYATCAQLADYAVSQGWLSYVHVAVVPGDDYPDGEATVAFLARDKGVLMLSKPTALAAATSAAIKAHGKEVKKVDFFGVGWEVYREVKSLNSARVTALSASGGPVSGGNKLVVTGSSLSGASKVRVGKVDVPAGSWKVDSGTQLTIASLPAGYGEGPVEITVFNYWGASPADTKDLYWYGGGGGLTPGEKVVRKAVEYLGAPYLWAGASPSTGFDCSGFCMYVYRQFGVSLPHYSRSMSTYGTAVSKSELQPGDLIFFYTPISHVGMYVGGGLMINAPRSGDLVCIEDAFRSGYVTARRMLSSPYSRYEQTESSLAYSGSWSNSNTTSASGGSFKYANNAGSSVTISFNGTYLGLIAKKSPVYGIAKVTLDNNTPIMLDLYSAQTVYLQKVWNTGTLTAGNHTIVVEWTGTKNASATDTNIGIDALDIAGSLTQTTSPPPPATPTRYDDSDGKIAYTGNWLPFTTSGPHGGSYTYLNSAGKVQISFTGTCLDLITTTGVTMGKGRVTLDGVDKGTVDFYSPTTLRQQKVWSTGTLASGNHTVAVSWTGQAGASGGTRINLDAVDVVGTLGQAASPSSFSAPASVVRVEQQDGRLSFAGSWTASSSTSASSGSFRYTHSSSSFAVARFNGTFLAWIGKKSPAYGKATVSLDGGTPQTIDLYSADTVWQQKLWDTGNLPEGEHTVRIECTGTKSASATAANINIDAFDIAGSLVNGPTVQPTRYEQTDAHLGFAGGWTRSRSSSASGGDFAYANRSGSSVVVTFVGSYLAWVTKKSPVYGRASVTLDGRAPVVVDLYGSKEIYQQKVWETGDLVPGTHSVKIEWTGSKGSAATDTNIGVDAFDVIGTLK
jgi:putative cell wall-binding protein